MKKILCLLLMMAPLFISSCWNDDEETVLADYCYIKTASLGTIKRAIHTTDSLGNDSVYYTSYTGSYFKLTIDNRTLTIENRDSLLYGSVLTSVLTSITYDGGSMGWRLASDTTAEFTTYSTSDSLDLTQPIQLMVVAENAVNTRIYTMKINVHQQQGDSLFWNRTDSATTVFDNMSDMRASVLGGTLMVLGQTTDGLQLATRNGLGSTGEWTLRSTNLPATAQCGTMLQQAGKLYLSTTDGAIYSSQNGYDWQQEGVTRDGLTLATVSNKYYYGLIDGQLYRSSDAAEWTLESLDDEASMLPSMQLNGLTYTQENGNNRILLCGARDNAKDTTAVVWSKMWQGDETEESSQWVYYTQTRENKYSCPRLQHLTLLAYDSKIMAIGGAPIDGGCHKAMDYIYVSNDNGITWKPDYTIHLPSDLLGVSGPIAAAVDENNFVWLIADNKVWRGRINRLGFARQ